jgi:type IV pilus assembly protein PilV
MVVKVTLKMQKAQVPKLHAQFQSGMMMIEVLISILIFSIGMIGMIALQTQAIKHSSDAQNRNLAANLANDLISQMWLAKTANPNNANLSSNVTTWKNQVKNSDLPNAAGAVVQSNGITTITISYKPPSKKSTENANQYVTQITIPE